MKPRVVAKRVTKRTRKPGALCDSCRGAYANVHGAGVIVLGQHCGCPLIMKLCARCVVKAVIGLAGPKWRREHGIARATK